MSRIRRWGRVTLAAASSLLALAAAAPAQAADSATPAPRPDVSTLGVDIYYSDYLTTSDFKVTDDGVPFPQGMYTDYWQPGLGPTKGSTLTSDQSQHWELTATGIFGSTVLPRTVKMSAPGLDVVIEIDENNLWKCYNTNPNGPAVYCYGNGEWNHRDQWTITRQPQSAK